MQLSGKERRRRFVYRTRNTEYHVFDATCVAVRDLRSEGWLDDHRALRQQFRGALRVFSNGAAIPCSEDPKVGQPIYFGTEALGVERHVVTSCLEAVDRPSLEDLDRYPRCG